MKQVIFGKSLLIAVATALVACAGAAQGAALDLQREIDAAAERGGGTVCVPAGEHEVMPFELKSNVTLQLADGARLLASTNIADYAADLGARCFIYAENATNVAVVGKGVLDGRGGVFREMKGQRGEQQPRALPILMRFSRCRDLRLEGFRYTNPGAWGCHLRNCDGVKVKGVSCFNYCNKTNDGLDIESCNVTVEDCDFFSSDDSFCFKTESDKSFPVTNVVVRNCRMGSTCNGIKFGTGSYNVFRDITIENCELRRSPGVWRFDWRKKMPGVKNRHCGIAGLALEVVDGGRMENVTIRNIKMEGYMTPIFIRHSNRHGPKDADTYLRNILIENVTGTCESRIASSITGVPAHDGMPARRPRNITLRNISLVAPGGGTEKDAAARVPEKDGKYPEAFMFDRMPLPAYGFYVRHADDVHFENVKVRTATPDARREFVFDDCPEPEQAVSLAGRWEFALGDTTNFVDSIMLPSTTDIARKGDGTVGGIIVEKIDPERDDAAVTSVLTRHLTRRYGYVGPATYARDIDIPADWAGRRVELVLERTKVVDAYIDDVHFAHSETLAAPAELALPGWISPGRHRLRLVVNNDIKAMSARVSGHQVSEDTQTNWNGIMGRIELRSSGQISMPQVKVFPSAAENKATAKVVFRNDGAAEAKFNVEICVSAQGRQTSSKIIPYVAPCGVSTGEFAVALGPDAPKWSEFSPVLHTLTVKAGGAQAHVRFGLRDFRAEGTSLVLNGRPVFLRGRHDACVWPLTGAAPMEVEPWRRYFRTLKDYGLNHVRFHSWCPPDAAFEAADEAGVYLQPEFSVFGGDFERNGALRSFCLEESKRIVDAYANHPSFVMFTLGNECRRGRKRRVEIVKALKAYDPRPLYSQATNGDWNSPRQCEGDDFWVTFRSCDGADGNVRGSYAHCNAPLGAVQIPGGGTMRDFSSAMRHTTIPLVGHETGQFQAYPDYSEIPKYTGVLKPVNLEIFRRRLKDAGLANYAAEFCKASGALMAINYREEIEEALRTSRLSGFQLLDIQDFPGQGTALVGILNAFMESKGFIAPEEWRRFCSPTVLLARFPRYTYEGGESFAADVQVFHYGREAILVGRLAWSIEGPDGLPVASGSFDASVPAGGLATVGKIECRLPSVADAGKFSLTLEMPGGLSNSYPLWIYPADGDAESSRVEIVRDIESADRVLSLGGTALCILDRAKAPTNSIPGFFTSDFWNWEMFNGPGRKRKAIAPGTLGLLVNARHPALAEFPTSFHSDYQWRELLFRGVNVILDGDDKADVIVRGIDNVTRNHNLGVIWEKRRGKGRVLYCSLDLEAAKDLPEARALRRSLLDYLAFEHLQPRKTK